MSRAAFVVALVALAVATAALVRHPAPSPYRLVCSEQFSSNGTVAPIWYPCSAVRP